MGGIPIGLGKFDRLLVTETKRRLDNGNFLLIFPAKIDVVFGKLLKYDLSNGKLNKDEVQQEVEKVQNIIKKM
ncbi:hypothetical protein LLG34_01115 [bacterium]|nr:hypothetical protein [bacterium]